MNGLFTLERDTAPRVWNKYHRNFPDEAVYIGRGSPWGNPYVIGEDGIDRKKALQLFEEYLDENPQLQEAIKRELAGKDLVCYCKPLPCHGDLLLTVANG